MVESCKVVLTFKCVVKNLWYDHLIETSSVVFSHATICLDHLIETSSAVLSHGTIYFFM